MVRSRFILAAVVVLAACKEPVEDQVSPAPPAPQAAHVARGQPPAEARSFVLKSAPPIRYAVNARFGDDIVLLGYDVEKTRYRPGEQVALTLYWKALADPVESWQVFMHLDPAGVDEPARRGYGDHFPVFGLYPTSAWKAGEVIRDQVTLPLKANVGADKAELWVGLYIDARRAKVGPGAPTDGKDRLKLATFEVEGPGATAPKPFTIHRAEGKIEIDGRLDEPSWQKVASTGRFVRTVGGGPPKLDTWAKLLWDDENLYIAFFCKDPDIRSPYTKRDDPLWQADAVEVFLQASADGKSYVELQVSPANVVFDAFFPERRPPPDRGGDLGYTANVRSAVRVDGTINKPGDRDRSWTVEMAIPFKDVKDAPRAPPRLGDLWRVNLVRTEKTGDVFDDAAWSAPGSDYHNLGAMKRVLFGPPPGKLGETAAPRTLMLRKKDLLKKLEVPGLEKRLVTDGGRLRP